MKAAFVALVLSVQPILAGQPRLKEREYRHRLITFRRSCSNTTSVGNCELWKILLVYLPR